MPMQGLPQVLQTYLSLQFKLQVKPGWVLLGVRLACRERYQICLERWLILLIAVNSLVNRAAVSLPIRKPFVMKIIDHKNLLQDPNARNCHGYRKFVKRTVLESPESGYLVNDTIIIRYTIELVVSSGGALQKQPSQPVKNNEIQVGALLQRAPVSIILHCHQIHAAKQM